METDPEILDLRDRVTKAPENMSLRLRLGRAYYDRGRYREALPEAQKARVDQEIRSEAIELQSMIFKRLGNDFNH
jgi:thioredoxin-like negative regulator of GroEL